jgi:hypothetical protein
VSLASPASTGIAAPHAGDFGIYAAFEQKLYRLGDHGIAASASLLAPTTARQTATSSIAVRTAAWSLLASATDARALDADFRALCGPISTVAVRQLEAMSFHPYSEVKPVH